jgi:outer membrane protein OmpA-like peptidoglycan-associated protein
MKTMKSAAALMIAAAFTTACHTVPTTTPLLEQSHNDYRTAQQDKNVSTYATLELQQASDALNLADNAAERHANADNVNQLAYIAKQKIALAQEVGKRKAAEASIPRVEKERNQMRLDERTNEVDQARKDALVAQTATLQAQARSSLLEQQLADLSAKQTARGIIITISDVLFASDQATLNPNGIRTIQKLAEVLQQNSSRNVLIEGYTDSTGTAAHNQILSERRANAVRGALQLAGVADRRMAIHGYGESYPVGPNDTATNRQLNRRVEILLSNDNGELLSR